jgi:fibronectin type 3 domain-containing protein
VPSDGGSPITNYNVYRGTASGGEALLGPVGNVTSYDDTTAANGTTYYYEVTAVNGVGEGPLSNEASATPHAPTAPAAPTLTAATAGNNTVHLSWTAPTDGGSSITNYVVYRGTVSGAETALTTVGNVTSYDDTTAANGTTYYYEVSAKNTVGEGPVSNERSATPQAPPDFSLSASPSSRSVTRGNSTTYTITINGLNGFSGSVSLKVSGLPSKTSSSFSPNPATTTSTLTVGTRPKAPRGTYPLTITGTSGGLTHTTSVTLTIT